MNGRFVLPFTKTRVAMRRIFPFIALLFFCVNAFSAKMKWEEITEKDWKVANKPGEESHAVIIFDKCWKDDRDNTSFRYYRRMKILDITGVDAGKVTVGFNASWTNEVRVRGRTLHPDGAVFELQEKDIHTKRVVKSGNVKVNETTFILPRVEPGCIIEYDYKAWGRSTRPLHVWNFQRKYPVSLSVFHWHMNPTTPTRYLLDRIPRDRYRVEKVPEESMYPVELIFTVWDMPPVVDEPFSHPESELTATGYYYYVSTVETAEEFWNNWAEDTSEDVEKFGKKAKTLPNIFAGAPEGASPEEKLEQAYYYLQKRVKNLDYLTKEEEEGRYKNPADRKNFDQMMRFGYGSSYDINSAFLAAARHLGLEAYMAGVNNKEDYYFKRDLLSWSQLANYVAVVEWPNGIVRFYDPGTVYLPFGRLNHVYRGINCLAAKGKKATLVGIPFEAAGDNHNKHSVDVTVGDDFTARIDYRGEFTGQTGYRLWWDFFDESEEARRDIVEEWIDDYFAEKVEIDDYRIRLPERSDEPIEVSASFTLTNVVEPAGSRVLLKPDPLRMSWSNPFPLETRESDIVFDYPVTIEDRVVIAPPDGFSIDALPEEVTWRNRLGAFKTTIEEKEGKVRYDRIFTRETPFLTPNLYVVAKKFYEEIIKFDRSVLVFKEEE